MPSLEQELRKTDTEMELLKLRQITYNKFYRISVARKQITLDYIRLFDGIRDVTTLDNLADKITDLLFLSQSPFDFAWKREYSAYFGYKYCLRFAWGFLMELAKK